LEERLSNLAWSILSDFHSQAAHDSSQESRLLIDATRLAALNWVTTSRFSSDYLDLEEGQLFFSGLSYECQKNCISSKEVGELAKVIIEDQRSEYRDDIQNLSVLDFVDLLGRIHSLGSYQLPTSLHHASSQRHLGAFYTPQAIADYIVNLTLGPTLKKHVSSVRRKGLSAVTAIVSLKTIDPACGTGVFLISALKAIQKAIQESQVVLEKIGVSKNDYEDYLSSSTMNVYGVDIDSGALEVTDVSLRLLESIGRTGLQTSHLGSTLKQGNSLITLNGFAHKSDNRRFFQDPLSRTAFEWDNEFKEVFSREQGGFDFVVMNPPYERLKPNFAEYMREELLSGERELHTSRFEENKSHIKENTRYFRESNEFKHAISYSLNTYQLFIERALQISKKGGSIGFIVPSNILCDVSAQSLRQELLLRNVVNTIDDFPEASKVFPGVTQSASILVITKGGHTEVLDIGLNRNSVEDAIRKKRLKIRLERILQIMGHSLVIPRVDANGLTMLERMHRQPSLSSIDYLSVKRGELDLTLNKNFISSTKSSSHLIRGSHITRYSLQKSNRDVEFVRLDSFRKTLKASKRTEHYRMHRIACQQVSNMGQRWRLKFAPIEPLAILSNSCNYLVAIHPDSSRILDFLLGVLNSELLNWRFQVSNSNNHVSIRELQSLPIIQPTDAQKKLEKNIIKDVHMLKSGTIAVSSSVEASVFALYGFGVKDASEILRMRRTPVSEQEKILEELSTLEGKRLSNQSAGHHL
jgi:adenine-specific DNA-methyltransferase